MDIPCDEEWKIFNNCIECTSCGFTISNDLSFPFLISCDLKALAIFFRKNHKKHIDEKNAKRKGSGQGRTSHAQDDTE